MQEMISGPHQATARVLGVLGVLGNITVPSGTGQYCALSTVQDSPPSAPDWPAPPVLPNPPPRAPPGRPAVVGSRSTSPPRPRQLGTVNGQRSTVNVHSTMREDSRGRQKSPSLSRMVATPSLLQSSSLLDGTLILGWSPGWDTHSCTVWYAHSCTLTAVLYGTLTTARSTHPPIPGVTMNEVSASRPHQWPALPANLTVTARGGDAIRRSGDEFGPVLPRVLAASTNEAAPNLTANFGSSKCDMPDSRFENGHQVPSSGFASLVARPVS